MRTLRSRTAGINQLKKKKCNICKCEYDPISSMQKVCGFKCSLILVETDKKKKFDDETKRLKASIKTRAQWLKEAQVEFNKFIRLRDAKEPCISCGRDHQGQYHAGHYRTVGAHPELRFNELNCHKQCAPCNNHLSGNILEYRISLAKKIGSEKLEWLEGPHELHSLSVDEIKLLKEKYKNKVKDIENDL